MLPKMSRRVTMLLSYLLLLSQFINALPQPNDVSSSGELFKDQHQNNIESSADNRIDHEHNNNNILTNDTNNPSNDNDEWSERDKLLFYTLEQFAILSNFTVEHGVKVLRNVLKDASTLKEPTATLLAHLGNFSDFVARAESLDKLSDDERVGELYDMVVLFTELVERHNTTALANATTTENLYLEMSLKKNGLDKLQVDFLERFLTFADKFNARMDSYLAKLSPEQRVNERKMIEWYRTFNAESDAEKRVEIFAKFFELYA
ncbi:unnamed protein product [Ceratitis capitata]|uniref:(Mediterranean fruit fly) hypothetical protein n=2 Tax=Ceratitis capitata TaxID=7213 RepID=A0A811UIQ6_CERCA|nr:unnamed protein product [Ceratitis capitata]